MPGENFPSVQEGWQFPGQRKGEGNRKHAGEIRWHRSMFIQTQASAKSCCAEVQKWDENPGPCSWWVHSCGWIHLALQLHLLGQSWTSASWDASSTTSLWGYTLREGSWPHSWIKAHQVSLSCSAQERRGQLHLWLTESYTSAAASPRKQLQHTAMALRIPPVWD